MDICIDITKEFNSVINFDCFFDSEQMYPIIYLDYDNNNIYHYEFELMNFGFNISDRIEKIFLEKKKVFRDIVECSFEYKRLLIYGRAKITICGVKGIDFRYNTKNETLYYNSPYQIEKGDFDFECGGFSSYSEHFVKVHIIANHDAKATMTFSSDEYFLINSDNPEFENIVSKKQTPFKIENNKAFDKIIKSFSTVPGKMFDINFQNKYFRINFSGEFNTSMAIDSEII